MSSSNREHPDRELLRRYLLDATSERERSIVEARLDASDVWRDALEAEREALAALDVLTEPEPPAGLADRAVRNALEAEEATARWRYFGMPALSRAAAVTLVAGAFVAAVAVAIIGPILHEASLRARAASNLQQLGLALQMYVNDAPGGEYPPMASQGLVMDLSRLYPRYLDNLAVVVNPALPGARADQRALEAMSGLPPEEIDWDEAHRIAARHVTYMYWAFDMDEEPETLARQLRGHATGEDLDDLVARADPLVLRQGVERFLITDINNPAAGAQAQSSIPVLLMNPLPGRERDGIATLFMDGRVHVEESEDFPLADEAFWRTLREDAVE